MFKRIMFLLLLFGFNRGIVFCDQVTIPFSVKDGLENTWTIQKDGGITGPHPFNESWRAEASILYIDKTIYKSAESAARTIYEKGTEISIGPQVMGSVYVTRKIYFGTGEGYVRYMEIIENRSTAPVTINLVLQHNMNSLAIVWENDQIVVADDKENHGTGALIFAGNEAAIVPKRNTKSSEVALVVDALSIQPQSKAVILHFVGVRPKREQALEFAQSFLVPPACINIDPNDLSNIVNFDPRTLGAKAGIEIFRGTENEAVLLKSGDKLTGSVQNSKFKIQTSYAQLDFPADKIATIIYEGGANNIERIVVLNGDIFSGFILDPEVGFKLNAGPLVNIRKEKISKLGFRIRADEKEKYPVVHDITLTNGDHFSGTVMNKSLVIGASFGDMPIEIDTIAKIEFISKNGVVTEITLKNGDKVSGFLKDEDIKIKLDFGGEVSIYQDRIEKIIFDENLLKELAAKKAGSTSAPTISK